MANIAATAQKPGAELRFLEHFLEHVHSGSPLKERTQELLDRQGPGRRLPATAPATR